MSYLEEIAAEMRDVFARADSDRQWRKSCAEVIRECQQAIEEGKYDRPALEALLVSIEEAEQNIDLAVEEGKEGMYDYQTERPKL